MPRIALDPGHGGKDPGAVGPTRVLEKNVNLAVCRKIAEKLRGSVDVCLTRDGDYGFGPTALSDLAGRVAVANQSGADVFISVHCNSADNLSARGMEVYTLPGPGPADQLAESIVRAWKAAISNVPVRKDLADGDSDKEANFYVLRKTDMPAVLVELAFISNPQEERLLAGMEFQDTAAGAIAAAVKSYFHMEEETRMADTEPWKQLIMEWGQDKLGLDKTHQADEPAPKWFAIAVAQRAYDVAKQDLIDEIIRRLNKA